MQSIINAKMICLLVNNLFVFLFINMFYLMMSIALK